MRYATRLVRLMRRAVVNRARFFCELTTGRNAMRELDCIVPGCQWHTRHDTDSEIIRRATEHLRDTHGEQVIRESMLETIKANIVPSKGQAA
jgi:predicted small metal-binding protein